MTGADMAQRRYIDRVVDREIEEALRSIGGVLVEGPKGVGKTSTGVRYARTVVRLDDTRNPAIRAALAVDPGMLLDGDPPVLVDEWQIEPALWNMVRREIDGRSGAVGQFILTGSATPDDDARRHSGAGRFWIVPMRPMSLFESGRSSGAVSLTALFDGGAPRGFDPTWAAAQARQEIADLIVTGGWPANIGLNAATAVRNNRRYLANIAEHDVRRVAGSRRDAATTKRVLRAFARHVSTPAYETTIARDLAAGQSEDGPDATSRESTRTHLEALTSLRIVEDLPAWNPTLRSARSARTTPKRHFVDPCLAAAALGVGAQRLAGEPLTLGLWFESLALRDLRVYAQPLEATVSYHRDSTGLEADIVVEIPDGRWGAVEVKLGGTQRVIDSAAEHLLKVASTVDSNRRAFLAVVTNGGIAHRRPDGIDVVPLRMLGP